MTETWETLVRNILETYKQIDTYKKTCERLVKLLLKVFRNILESCLKHVIYFLEIFRDLLETCLRLQRDMFYIFCYKFMRHVLDIRLQIDKKYAGDLTENCIEAYQNLLETFELLIRNMMGAYFYKTVIHMFEI